MSPATRSRKTCTSAGFPAASEPGGLDAALAHLPQQLGAPGVPDHVSLWGLLIPIRRAFRQYVNPRPVRVFEGVASPVRGARIGVSRIADYAFELARTRRRHVTSATKSNGIVHTMPFWDEVVAERAAAFPDVQWRSEHIDALAAKFVLQPGSFDVVVASNLLGDILSDLAAAAAGSIGIAPSGNLDPTRACPSMFEPVHGSAPDIAGKGVANPVGAVWSAAMMLEHLGRPAAAQDVLAATESTLREPGTRTRDLGGTADTREVTATLVDRVRG